MGHQKNRGLFLLILVCLGYSSFSLAESSQAFRGEPPHSRGTWGLIGGLGTLDSSVGLAVIGTAAKTVLQRGFVPDINNQVFVEGEFGPLFVSGGAVVTYSGHLRWDFHMNQEWSFFALGGLGGLISGDRFGNRWSLYPRFGIGAFWLFKPDLALRGEISHELIVVGLSFPL